MHDSIRTLQDNVETMQIAQIPSIIQGLRQQVELFEGLKLKLLDHPISGVTGKMYGIYELTIAMERAHEAYLLAKWKDPSDLPEVDAIKQAWAKAAKDAGMFGGPPPPGQTEHKNPADMLKVDIEGKSAAEASALEIEPEAIPDLPAPASSSNHKGILGRIKRLFARA